MPEQAIVSENLANDLIDRIEAILVDAERETKPLEIDPYRSRLFELFVVSDAAVSVLNVKDADLTADGIGRVLSQRWNLKFAAQQSMQLQTKLPAEHLSKMRLLWSFLRMWMEWSYAWQRWSEFHSDGPRVTADDP